MSNLITNRRARHEYTLGDTYEAGVVLQGTEVKSIRAGRANLQEAWVRLEKGEAWLVGCHVSPYAQGNRNNHEPLREKKLLMKRAELDRLHREVGAKGNTLVPTRIYISGRRIKVEIAVAKGKKLHDKRHALKEKQAKRDMQRG
jgi:SsrA-binding protein